MLIGVILLLPAFSDAGKEVLTGSVVGDCICQVVVVVVVVVETPPPCFGTLGCRELVVLMTMKVRY